MRYLKAGSGPALILIHGLLGYSFSFRFVMPVLAPYATIYAVDNLGFGLSPSKEGMDCSLAATSERILQFADALGIKEFDIFGSSYGGAIAIVAASLSAERAKPRVRRMILAAPVNPWSPHGKRLAPFVGSTVGSYLFRNTIARWRTLDHLWLRRMFGDPKKVPPDSLDGYRLPILNNNVILHGSRVVKNWTRDLAVLEKALPATRNYRTLLMWGTKDRVVNPKSARKLRDNFRDAQLVIFKGVGHLPYEETPDEFNQAMIKFLTDL